MPFRYFKNYFVSRLWSLGQYPDPVCLYRRGGIAEIIRYLHACPAPGRVRDILVNFGARIDEQTHNVGPWITIHPPRPEKGVGGFGNLCVDARVHIGAEVFLDLSDRIEIESDVTVAMRSIILTHFYLGSPETKPLARVLWSKEAPVILRRGCSIGAGAIISCGVEIGEDAMIGAGVFVNSNVPPRTIVRSSAQMPNYLIPDRRLGPCGQQG